MSQSVAMVNEKFKKRSITWLMTAVVMLVLWVLVWLFHGTPKTAQETKTQEVTTQDFALPKRIDSFEQLTKEVPPVDFSAVVRDLRNYPSEFKDKRFFQQHNKRWTVQVMDVAQNDIITSYLGGRSDDREKFVYFRYRSSDGEMRYILTYGVMGSSQEALGAIKTVDFNLPKNVRPVPEQMQHYLDIIDNYEHHEEIVDSAPNAPRAVKLQKTRTEIPAAAPKEKPKKSDKETAPTNAKPAETRAQTQNTESKTKERPARTWQDEPKIEPEEPKKPRSETPKVPVSTAEAAEKPKPRARPETEPEVPIPNTNAAKVPGSDL